MDFLPFFEKSENQKIEHPLLDGFQIYIKREDKIHPVISGNKYRKLKYNLVEAKNQKAQTLITFGGAHSNHITAVAEAGFLFGYQTIGIIRGEDYRCKAQEIPTLIFAKKCGMNFEFITRTDYKCRHEDSFVEVMKSRYEGPYFLPEGGTNALGVKGCLEILGTEDQTFDTICCAVGTGGTLSGIIESSLPSQRVLGFSSLRENTGVLKTIGSFTNKKNWSLFDETNFGGYGRVTTGLVDFINTFYKHTKIPLDPIYTGKMMFSIFEMLKKGCFRQDEKVLIIHTGGLQGISGMNIYLRSKNHKPIVV